MDWKLKITTAIATKRAIGRVLGGFHWLEKKTVKSYLTPNMTMLKINPTQIGIVDLHFRILHVKFNESI